MVRSHKQHRWSMKRWQVALAVLLLVLVLAGVYVFMVLTKTPSAMLRDSVFAAVGAAPVSGTAEASSAVVGTITQTDKSRVTLAGNQAQFASRITTTLSPDITLRWRTAAFLLKPQISPIVSTSQLRIYAAMKANGSSKPMHVRLGGL